MIGGSSTGALSEGKATCRAGSNIAFIKYWGLSTPRRQWAAASRQWPVKV